MKANVSVLVPTYNRASLLVETVESILGQTYPPSEIIIVDDGSTDDTAEAVKSHFADKVKYHPVANGGVCRARNIAASLATSPYLALCDSDDLWRSDKLALQMELHNSHPELEYSFTNFSIVSDGVWAKDSKFDKAPAGLFPELFYTRENSFLCNASLYDELLQFQPIFPSTVLMKKTFFDKIGGFDEAMAKNPIEDTEFTLRCVMNKPIGVVCQPAVGIRKHTSNVSGEADRNSYGRIAILEYALKHHALNPATKEIVLRQIALEHLDLACNAFQREDFSLCASQLSGVPPAMLDLKQKMKLWLCTTGRPLAGLAGKFLNRS